MLEVKKPTSALEKNEENIGSQENSHDSGNESNELPVEIKAQEQNYRIDESEGEISEEAIQMQVRAGFIRKVYGILSIQLIITFGAVFLFQIPFFKSFVILHQSLAGNMLILTSLAFMTLFYLYVIKI